MGKKWVVILIIVIIAVFLYFRYQDGSLTLPTGSEIKDSDGDTIQDKYDKCPFLYGPVENDGCPMEGTTTPPPTTLAPTTAAPTTPAATTAPTTAAPTTAAPTFGPKPTTVEYGDYPMAGSLQIHHYFSPTDISYTPSLLWSYDLDSSAEFPSEPAIGYGNAYIYADNGILSCVDLDTGLPVWSQQVSGSSYHTPALGDGNVYVCTSEGVFAFEAATGTYQWSYTTGTYSMTDPMTIEGAVYCAGDRVVSLDAASGTLLWDYGLPSPAWTSPSAGTSNTLSGFLPALLVATQSQMFVFNMETGAVEYTIPVMNPTNITCLFDLWFVNSEGGIVEFTNSGNVNAIAKSSDPWVTYASSTAADSYVSYYYYSSDGNLYNYSVGGVKQWESTVGEVLDYGPVLGNNFVYLSFRDGTIRAFYRATGMQKWSLQLDYLSDFCIAHGKLYAVSGGYLQCYG